MSTKPDRPDLVTLLDWIEGRLPAPESDRVAEAVLADPRTKGRVGWLRRVRATAEWTLRNQPPAEVRSDLMASYDRWWQRRSADVGDPTDVVLELAYDSRTDLTVVGSRGGGPEPGVHLAYAGEEADVVVDLVPTLDHRFRLEGQLLASGDPPGLIEASIPGGPGEPTTTIADSLGRFTFLQVPVTVTELIVRSDRVRLRMSLDLRT